MKKGISATEIVEPYAKALMSIAREHDLVDRMGEDVGTLREMLQSSEELQQFLDNPIVKAESKKSVLRQIVGDRLHSYTLNFLMLLVDRGRILFLDDICQNYQAQLRQLKNIVLAEVTSAGELSDRQKDAIRDKVKSFTGASDVELELEIDPELIGGIAIRVGSQVLDASLRGQLRRLALNLS